MPQVPEHSRMQSFHRKLKIARRENFRLFNPKNDEFSLTLEQAEEKRKQIKAKASWEIEN